MTTEPRTILAVPISPQERIIFLESLRGIAIPLEWAWRSLTYWKKQPFRKNSNNTDTMGMA